MSPNVAVTDENEDQKKLLSGFVYNIDAGGFLFSFSLNLTRPYLY